MKVELVGAGSLGLLLAGKLAAVPGLRLRLVARGAEQAGRIAREGIAVTERGGSERRYGAIECVSFEEAEAEARAAPAGGWERRPDWLLAATKQTHWTEALLRYAAHAAEAGARLLLFQNGIGHEARLIEAGVPAEQLYLAVTTEGARRMTPCAVAHTGAGTTLLGTAAGERGTAALPPIRDALRAAGFEAEIVPEIGRHVRRKLLVNGVINPLTAVLGVTNGELAASSEFRKVMRALFEEAAAAMMPDLAGEEKEAVWSGILDVCERTAANASSMLQDMAAGNATEIEAITGAIVREAEAAGTPAPTHAALYAMVRGLERRNRG